MWVGYMATSVTKNSPAKISQRKNAQEVFQLPPDEYQHFIALGPMSLSGKAAGTRQL